MTLHIILFLHKHNTKLLESPLYFVFLLIPAAEGYPLSIKRETPEYPYRTETRVNRWPNVLRFPNSLLGAPLFKESASCLVPPQIGNRMWEGSVSPLGPPLKQYVAQKKEMPCFALACRFTLNS